MQARVRRGLKLRRGRPDSILRNLPAACCIDLGVVI